MENKSFKFKTNINCGGCISTVKPFLDGVESIEKWEVDVSNRDKILTVEASEISEKEIIEVLNKAGYKAESLS